MFIQHLFTIFFLTSSLSQDIILDREGKLENEISNKKSEEIEIAEFEKFESDPKNNDHILKAKAISCYIIVKQKELKRSKELNEFIQVSKNKNPISSLFLPECFSKINLMDAFEIYNDRFTQSIDFTIPEFDIFFPIQFWSKLYSSGDEHALKRELERIDEIIPELKKAQLILRNEKINEKQNKIRDSVRSSEGFQNNFKINNQEEKKQIDTGLFSFLCIEFQKISPFIKNTVGYFFLISIIIFLIYAVRKLPTNNQTKFKKSKQKIS